MDNQTKFEDLNPFFKAVMGGSQGSSQQLSDLTNVQFLPKPMDRAVRDATRGTGRAIESVYGQLDKNVFGGLLPGGAESIFGKVKRVVDGDVPIQVQPPATTSQVQPPATTTPQTSTKLPGDQPENTTTMLPGLAGVLEREFEERGKRFDRITSREYLDDQQRRRQEELAYATNLLSRAQMAQMKESTRRNAINAWRDVTNQQIKRDAVLGSSMLQAAYLSATPNANVLSALAGPAQQAMAAFKPGQAVI